MSYIIMVPHKHAEVIKAWADGATIQTKGKKSSTWTDVTNNPLWSESQDYRVKPQPKPDVMMYGLIDLDKKTAHVPATYWRTVSYGADNIKAVFDGETGKLKDVKIL